MALDNWKRHDGEWGNGVVTFVAICGVLSLAGFYYLFADGMERAVVTHNGERASAATTNGTGTQR